MELELFLPPLDPKKKKRKSHSREWPGAKKEQGAQKWPSHRRYCGQEISYTVEFASENGRFRLKAKSGFLTQSKKSLRAFSTQFFFDGVFPSGGSSRKTWHFRLDLPVEKISRKGFTCVFLTHRIAYPTIKHTPTHPYQVPHSSTIQQRRRLLGYQCCCFSPQISVAHAYSSARQQRASHDDSSARYRCLFADNGYACCSFGGSRMSATPQT